MCTVYTPYFVLYIHTWGKRSSPQKGSGGKREGEGKGERGKERPDGVGICSPVNLFYLLTCSPVNPLRSMYCTILSHWHFFLLFAFWLRARFACNVAKKGWFL